MSEQWPHSIRIFSPDDTTSGTSTPDGVFTQGTVVQLSTDLYNGRADVQDGGKMFDQDTNGQFSNVSDAVVFLKRISAVNNIVGKKDLVAEVTWTDQTKSVATIVKVRRIDGTIWLKWV